MLDKIVIANRGEIALRILRAWKNWASRLHQASTHCGSRIKTRIVSG